MSDNKTLRNVKTEMDKRMAALDDSSIATVFVSYCKISKYATFLCDKKCGSNVISNGDIPAGIKLVRDLRKHIWVNPDSISMGDSELERKLKELSGRDHRNVLMLNDLFRMKQVGGKVRFTIGYDRIEVCKDFFRKCTGFGKKSFNKLLRFVEDFDKPDRAKHPYDKYFSKQGVLWALCGRATLHLPKERDDLICTESQDSPIKTAKTIEHILVFLDNFFDFEDIDYPADAGKKGCRYTRMSWRHIYDKYEQYCKKLRLPITRYDVFCSTRKQYRSNYKKHRCTRAGGWDHLECQTCSQLDRKIHEMKKTYQHETSGNHRIEKEKDIKSLEDMVNEHRGRAKLSRHNYYRRRAKAVEPQYVKKGYLSMTIDAAGAQAANYSPRYSTTEKGEPARHHMLKMKSTYVKVHGVGGLVLTSFPELEKQGGNLTVESLLRGIRFAARELNTTSFRNIYVQLDNTNTNKCVTFIVACALLVRLGVCKKIKVNYLEVGHTHEDIDALIGSVVVKLRVMDLPTIEKRLNAIMDALNSAEAHIKAVEELIGITDYESVIEPYLPQVTGTMKIKEFRITSDGEGNPIFLYKSNSTVDGWYPRPFEKLNDFDAIAEVFKTDDCEGAPTHISVTPGSSTKSGELGKRQHWYYKVRFAGGSTVTYPMKCIGIPITVPVSIADIVESLPAQPLDGKLSTEDFRCEVLSQIKALLVARSDTEYIPTWETYFQGFTAKVNIQAHYHEPVFQELVKGLGGPVQQSIEHKENVVLNDADIVAPVTFRGSDIQDAAERQKLLENRADIANAARLLGRKKRIASAGSKKLRLKPKTKKASVVRRGKRKVSKKSDDSDNDIIEEEGKGEEEVESLPSEHSSIEMSYPQSKKRKKKQETSQTHESDNGSSVGIDRKPLQYDLKKYDYLLETPHYDQDDDAVYACEKIVAEDYGKLHGVLVVVYRRKFNAEEMSWEPVNWDDAVNVGDVEKYFNDDNNDKYLSIMSGESTKGSVKKRKQAPKKKKM